MERQPIPSSSLPGELTHVGQNAYPNNMPDGGSGGGPETNPSQGQGSSNESWEAQIRRNAADENSPQRDNAREILARMEQMQGRASQAGGARENQQEAQNPQQPTSENGNATLSQAIQDLTSTLIQSRRSGEAPEETVEKLRYYTGRGERAKDLDLAISESSHEERMNFFNGLFLTLDSRPGEFSDVVFGQLTPSGTAFDTFMTGLSRVISGESSVQVTEEQRKQIHEDYLVFQEEANARKVTHDMTAIMYTAGIKAESLFGYVEKFQGKLVDLVFTTPGIRQMTDLYEYAIRESMATHKFKGFLDPEKITATVHTYIDPDGNKEKRVIKEAEIDLRTKALFTTMMEAGLIKSRTKDGKEFAITGLKPWEVDRLFNFARGGFIGSGRMISLAAESKLPPGPTRAASGFLQDLVQEYSALKHLNGKWGITSEALAAYLYKGTTGNVKKDKLLQRWNPRELQAMWDRYHDDPDKLLYSLSEVFYLGRMNPNRAGDVWTWMSWRGENKSDAVTMVQNFLVEGEKKMARRWNDTHPTGPRAEDYIAFMSDSRFKPKELSEEEFFSLTKDERKKEMDSRRAKLADREAVWKSEHPGGVEIKEFEKFYKEYQNWSGTGFRFEKMRANLEKAVDYTQHGMDHHEKEKLIHEGNELLARMADLQGHRFYTKSHYIRTRVDGKTSPEMKQNMQMILADLQLTEAAFLNSREAILDAGIRFNDAELDMGDRGFDFYQMAIKENNAYKDKDGNVISVAERIRLAKEFTRLMKSDYHENHAKYEEEFITKREYTHGFVLWTGDVPIDEYNASAVGPTGAFTRRARDNKNQALATGAESKMLDNLKNIHSVEQLYEHFEEIFGHIDHYDRGKAQQAVAEKLLGVLRFYKADSITKIPGVGLAWHTFKGGKTSFARMQYGPGALSLESSQINNVIEHFAHHKKITHEQEKWLKEKLGGTTKHLVYELGLDTVELGMLAVFLEMLALMGREIVGGIKEAG